jgi:hypothetical protein
MRLSWARQMLAKKFRLSVYVTIIGEQVADFNDAAPRTAPLDVPRLTPPKIARRRAGQDLFREWLRARGSSGRSRSNSRSRKSARSSANPLHKLGAPFRSDHQAAGLFPACRSVSPEVSEYYLLSSDWRKMTQASTAHLSRESWCASPKQHLSTFDLDQIDGLLDKDIDPTGKFTPRKLLQLFLAYLLERAAAEAESQQLPWPVPLRLARPAWKAERAEAGEALLKSLVKEGFALAEALGPALTAPGGLSQRQALAALKKLKPPTAADVELFLLSEEGNASVREATAVASGAIRDNGRRVVVVVDIGGGTSDFGVFATGLAWRNVIAEVEGSSAILTEAGDHLDMLLRAFILKKAGLSADHPAGAGAARRLLILGRQHKERLFSDRTLTVELGERYLEVTLTEFLAEPQVAAFADRLRERCRHAVEIAVACARDFQRLSRRRTPVSFLFTGGGHDLPMVRALATDPGVSWHYDVATPICHEHPRRTPQHRVQPGSPAAGLETANVHWLCAFDPKSRRLMQLRKIAADIKLNEDHRVALSLAALNEDLPLCVRGEIITPNWLLPNPEKGGAWLDTAPQRHLRDLKRDKDRWLVQLAERAERVKARIRDMRLTLGGAAASGLCA